MKKETISNRLKSIMKERNIKQVDILRMSEPFQKKYSIKLVKSNLSEYVNGKVTPDRDKIFLLSKTLDVSEPWLMGYDVNKRDNQRDLSSVKNISFPQAVKVPVLGNIAAGTPLHADDNIEDYLYLDRNLHVDFCLKVRGDSMIDAGISNGDTALIKQQPVVENGEIAAVVIGDEATLKKVHKTDDTLVLYPCNSQYEPIVLKEKEDVYIAGKLVGVLKPY